jgi:hypothetical protein
MSDRWIRHAVMASIVFSGIVLGILVWQAQ